MNIEATVSTKKKNRLLKEKRRRHPEVSKEIILHWEELRQKSVKAERKYELCEKIVKASKTVVVELIKQKTTARVFESVIEFGSEEHRWSIFEIVKSELLDMCKGKYSNFVINKMLKFGTKDQRLSVFSAIKGHIVELLAHSHSSNVVELAYNDVATSTQRREMVQEFYGKTFALFNGDKEVNHLSEATSATKYDLSILKNFHELLLPVLRKSIADLTIVQHVLFEYFGVLTTASVQQAATGGVNHYEPLVEEIVELMQEQVMQLCNTREGTKVAMLIYWYSNAKNRKKILTAAKEVASKLCVSGNSYLFILTVIDQTDDVKTIEKLIIKPILAELDLIGESVHGRKVIQFILNHRDKNFFDTVILNLLAKGDCNPYSKKDSAIRASEILEMAKKPLLKWLLKNIDESLNFAAYINVATSILNKCIPSDEDMKKSYSEILSRVALIIDEAMVPVSAGNKRKMKDDHKKVPKKKSNFAGKFEDEVKTEEVTEVEVLEKIDTHILESSGGQVLMRALFNLEKEKKIEGFSSAIIETLHVENLLTFITCNRTAFFLVNLFECGNEAAQKFLREALKSQKTVMAKSALQGVKILYKHLH